MKDKLHFEIDIHASPEQVYERITDDLYYRMWAAEFYPGSFYVGSWDKNESIQFVIIDKEGRLQGIFSRIEENVRNKFISIEHLGVIVDGEKVSGPEAASWKGAHENYTLEKADNFTRMSVDIDNMEEMEKYLLETWPIALNKLKEICEQ
jgi:hypothetical protein